jgi:16S rRNA (cytosine967-C5)-methyltransferase
VALVSGGRLGYLRAAHKRKEQGLASAFAAPAREVALDVLLRVENDGAFSHLALSGALRRLEGRDRGLATELVYGTLARRLWLDYALGRFASKSKTDPVAQEILRLAAFQLLCLSRIPAHAAIFDAVTQTRRRVGERASGFVNAVLRRLVKEGATLPEGQSSAALSLRYSAPAWLVERRLSRLPADDVEAWLAAELRPAPLTLRVVPERATVERCLAGFGERAHVEPGTLSPLAMRVRGLAEPFETEPLRSAWCAVQDEGAQAAALALAPAEASRVLDACCGFGGKSLHLASLTRAPIVGLDLVEKKLQSAAREAERFGYSHLSWRRADLAQAPADLGEFSHILLDAPCTGLGTLRRHPELRWRRTPEEIRTAAALQVQLAREAARLLAPEGVLVYSVCSPEPEEGEDVVRALLAAEPGLVVEPIDLESLRPARTPEGFARPTPHQHDADAFFIARLRRRRA